MVYSYQSTPAYSVQNDPMYNPPVQKKSALPLVIDSGVVGAAVGGVLGAQKNPFLNNSGEVSESLIKKVFNNFINSNNGNPYKNKTRILNQINSINTAEEFKALLNANTQIADEILKTLDVSVDEFINNINEKNLLVNKKNIKDKLTIENKMYYQNFKNQVESCWDAKAKKFVKADGIKDDLYNSIKASTKGAKAKLIGIYALVGMAVAGISGFIIGKFLNK